VLILDMISSSCHLNSTNNLAREFWELTLSGHRNIYICLKCQNSAVIYGNV
jgi:hypothetical protein